MTVFWKAFASFMAIVNAILIGILFVYIRANRHAVMTPTNGLEYKDFLSILLTALGVMIAVLTLFLAVIAIWGFSALRDEARRIALEEARRTAGSVATRTTSALDDQRGPSTAGGDYGEAAGKER